jgi:helix-turn-helix protein
MSNKKIRHIDYNAPVTEYNFSSDENDVEEHQESFEEIEEHFEEQTQEDFSAAELIAIYKMMRADPTEQI